MSIQVNIEYSPQTNTLYFKSPTSCLQFSYDNQIVKTRSFVHSYLSSSQRTYDYSQHCYSMTVLHCHKWYNREEFHLQNQTHVPHCHSYPSTQGQYSAC